MPKYFFDTYDKNISQNKPIMTHIIITLLSYNITLSLKSNITIPICYFYDTLL